MRAVLVPPVLFGMTVMVLTPGAIATLGVFCVGFAAAAVNQWGGLWRVKSRGKQYDWE